MPKLKTSGVQSNCLFFADDANIHAANISDIKSLLETCEQWSTRVGMQFSPAKCLVLHKAPIHLSLYGNPLTQVDSATYLGIPFNVHGIDWVSHCLNRSKKAKFIISALGKLGMNGTGWPYRSSSLVYKLFIRSTLEYGIALSMLPPKALNILQLTQNMALRTILGAGRNISINAMHKFLNIETMATRNAILNAQFAARLHNSSCNQFPSVNLWWNRLTDDDCRSLTYLCSKKNPLWTEMTKLNHVLVRRNKNACVPAPAFTLSQKKKIIQQSLIELDHQKTNVAGVIVVDSKRAWRHLTLPNLTLSKKQRITITRWIIGGVAKHQPCKNCPTHEPLSREHDLKCSGAETFLASRYHSHWDRDSPLLLIDQLLNKFRLAPPSVGFYNDLYYALSNIYSKCLGFSQKDNGYWASTVNPSPVSSAAPVTNAPQRRPLAQPISRTLARARVAAQRNRPLGRPRRSARVPAGIG